MIGETRFEKKEGRGGKEHGGGTEGRVDSLLQGLKAMLFELQLLLEVNHLPLQLIDLNDKDHTRGQVRG